MQFKGVADSFCALRVDRTQHSDAAKTCSKSDKTVTLEDFRYYKLFSLVPDGHRASMFDVVKSQDLVYQRDSKNAKLLEGQEIYRAK
jgi:hypothetical protein